MFNLDFSVHALWGGDHSPPLYDWQTRTVWPKNIKIETTVETKTPTSWMAMRWDKTYQKLISKWTIPLKLRLSSWEYSCISECFQLGINNKSCGSLIHQTYRFLTDKRCIWIPFLKINNLQNWLFYQSFRFKWASSSVSKIMLSHYAAIYDKMVQQKIHRDIGFMNEAQNDSYYTRDYL